MMDGVPVGRVPSMRVLKRQAKRLGTSGHKHQMNVVGHQTISHRRHIVQGKTLLEQIKIHAAIGIAVENKPAIISTLGHVVG
jgi:hypothetical protein